MREKTLGPHSWENINWPRGDNRFVAGKAGQTLMASDTLAGVFKVQFSEYGDREIGIVILGSSDRNADVNQLISFLESNFVYGNVPVTTLKKTPVFELGASIYRAIGR